LFWNLVHDGKQPYIVGDVAEVNEEYISLEEWLPVIPKTVGQFIGRKDKNGKKIYEGDICQNGDWVSDAHAHDYRKEEVTWDEDSACWQGWELNEDGMCCEVIGDIYENKELLV